MTERDFSKAATRGEPSYLWRAGQERRFRMIQDAAGDHVHGSVLDIGCGIGLYLERLAEFSPTVYGVEFDFPRAKTAREKGLCLTSSAGEFLPFPSNTFDLVLSHEVLEHVEDDRSSIKEIIRVLKAPKDGTPNSGGKLLLFVPNWGYPFETHGVFFRGKYRFGNIPLVNYLPRPVRDRLAPHVRIYSKRDLEKLFEHLPIRVLNRTIIFGGYDNIIAKWPSVGRGLRKFLQMLEATPLRYFGLSHFWVIERIS